MKIVSVYARKGGVGKSTFSYTLACYAAEQGMSVMLVCADPQGDAARWASGGDRALTPDDLFKSDRGFDVLYAPGDVPKEFDGNHDLVVVDLPPEGKAIRWVEPALWLSPHDGRDSLLDTLPVMPAMLEQSRAILVVFNRAEVGGKSPLKMLQDAVAGLDQAGLRLWHQEIPNAGSVARVKDCHAPPWETPYGSSSAGTKAIREMCQGVFNLLPHLSNGRS